MKEYRFKCVANDGSHTFHEFEHRRKEDAFRRAYNWCMLSSVDHIDVYNENDKKIATFYK